VTTELSAQTAIVARLDGRGLACSVAAATEHDARNTVGALNTGPDEIDDSDDHWLEDHAEEVLAGHDAACIESVIQDAYDHGIDDPAAVRCVAGQFLEDGDSDCRCAQPKT
jgi:hypothetical protein